MPPYQGGGDMIGSVTFEKTTYNELPYKFEAGTPEYRRRHRIGRGDRLYQPISASTTSPLMSMNCWTMLPRAVSAVPGVRLIGTAEGKGRRALVSCSTTSIRTTSEPSSTGRESPFALGTIAPSR